MTRIILLLVFLQISVVNADIVPKNDLIVGGFSSGDLKGWSPKIFNNTTEYALSELDGELVLKAISNNSASALVKTITVNIKEYPYLNWRWRVDTKVLSTDETKKSGDDYSARLYVMKSGGLFFWNTKALNYVWSSLKRRGDHWPSAFAPSGNQMIALRSSEDKTETWYVEKINVYKAFKQWQGSEVKTIDAIAIMTDTDNTHQQAKSFFGDIYFSKD
jgi:hypothetical protein